MLISLLAAGSRGDVQPFVALGVSLKQAGYSVRIVASENFETLVTSYGLEYHRVHGDVSKIASSSEVQSATQGANPLKMIISFNKLKAFAFELQKDYFAGCQDSDAIVYHPGATLGFFAAQAQKIPSILASPFPMTPTRDYPALLFYNGPRLGKPMNLLSHKVFEQVMWQTSSGPVKQFWKQTFGITPENFSSPFRQQRSSRYPTIVSCSNYVFPRPEDWPKHVYNTGYWFVDDDNWQPPKGLQDFLDKGPAPIYVGFGSISHTSTSEQTTDTVIEALKRTGQRGLLATGWSGMTQKHDLPETIFMLEQVPHSWLFPKMAAVVHHGGAGTTAAGLRAGVPNIVIPHGLDQFAWARRIYELGVAPKPIPKKKLSVETLTEAIKEALTEEKKSAARALGQNIMLEHGNDLAVEIIIKSLKEGYRS